MTTSVRMRPMIPDGPRIVSSFSRDVPRQPYASRMPAGSLPIASGPFAWGAFLAVARQAIPEERHDGNDGTVMPHSARAVTMSGRQAYRSPRFSAPGDTS